MDIFTAQKQVMYKERQELILKRTFHRLISYSLTLVCLLTVLTVPGRAANILYSDVPQDAWYMDGVEYVTKNGIMAGTGKGKFSPSQGMTRAMLVQVLYAAAGKPKAPGNPFVDVPKGSWYEESSAWAVENGIVSGYEGKKFGGNDPITRQQFVTILWRYAGSPEAKTGKYFSDRSAMADYAREPVNWARAANIISGGDGNKFAPGSVVIRSHCAAILKNYMLMGPKSLDVNNAYVSSARIDPTKQQTFYLWDRNNRPKTTQYTYNAGNYMDDMSFQPSIITYPVPSGTIVKGAVLVLAGGSFQQRSNGTEGYPVADQLSQRGYVSFVVNYRLYPYSMQDAQMDLARAIRFVRHSAGDYGYNEKNIAVLGFSAGAMAAGGMMLDFGDLEDGSSLDGSYRPDEIDKLSTNVSGNGMIYGFFGNLKTSIKDVERYKEAQIPETFFCYGANDSYAPECKGCIKALEEAGVTVKTVELPGMGHGFGLKGDWLGQFDSWLSRIYIRNALIGDR